MLNFIPGGERSLQVEVVDLPVGEQQLASSPGQVDPEAGPSLQRKNPLGCLTKYFSPDQ